MTRPRFLPDNFTLTLLATVILASLLPASGQTAVAFGWVGVVGLWGFFVFYAAVMAVVLWLRYRGRAWQTLRLVRPAAEGQ